MPNQPRPDWKHATFSGTEAARRFADRQLSFREKLEWNYRMVRLESRFEQGRRKLKIPGTCVDER